MTNQKSKPHGRVRVKLKTAAIAKKVMNFMPQATNAHVEMNIADRLLHWYDIHARSLPWRKKPGQKADPWHILLSEIMLQQTTVATVTPRFQRFIDLWPTPSSMALSPRDDVLAEWAGLGYYARARNLHKCATAIHEDHNGKVPDTEESLKSLPGIGDYTGAAIAAIAFGRRAVVVDGNVERVMSRLFAITDPLPGSKATIRQACDQVTPDLRAGDFAQGLMDLASSICKPKNPSCLLCPVQEDCEGLKQGIAADLPKKQPKKAKPQRYGHAYILINDRDEILLVKRPDKGLLGGMTAFPGSDWVEDKAPDSPPHTANWQALPGTVTHVFTHFRLELTLQQAHVTGRPNIEDGFWYPLTDLGKAGLPTVMTKVAKLADILS